MRLRVRPRDPSFLEAVASAGTLLVDSTNVLASVLGADEDARAELARRSVELQVAGAEIGQDALSGLARSFVTSLDRDDSYVLVSAINDCLDAVAAAVDLVTLLRPGTLHGPAADLVEVLQRQAELGAEGLHRLRSPERLLDRWVESRRLRRQAGQHGRRLLADRLIGSPSAAELVRQQEIRDALVGCSDTFAALARTIDVVVVKET